MKDTYYVLVNPETKRLYTLEERRDLGLISQHEYYWQKVKQEWRAIRGLLRR